MATGILGSKFFRSKTVGIVLILLVVAVVGLVAFQAWRLMTQPAAPDETSIDPTSNELVLKASQVATKATNLAETGDYNGAYKIIDDELASAATDGEQYVLIMTKSDLAMNNPDQGINQAIKYAIEADAKTQTYKSAAAVARLYAYANDKPNAIAWYQKTIDRYKVELAKAQPQTDNRKSSSAGQEDGIVTYYKTLIDELNR